jgi:hypothetical protein
MAERGGRKEEPGVHCLVWPSPHALLFITCTSLHRTSHYISFQLPGHSSTPSLASRLLPLTSHLLTLSISMVKLSRKLSSRRHLRAPKAPKNMFPLRRSARLAPIVDDSRVEPLELCNDLVDYEDNGVIIHKFRVSISQLARAQLAASRQFEWADVSQSYCSDHALVPASLEVCLLFHILHLTCP